MEYPASLLPCGSTYAVSYRIVWSGYWRFDRYLTPLPFRVWVLVFFLSPWLNVYAPSTCVIMVATPDSADLKFSVIIDSPSTASASIQDLEKSSDITESSTVPGSIQAVSDNVDTAASLHARSRSDYSQEIGNPQAWLTSLQSWSLRSPTSISWFIRLPAW
jgi:hypothetical protein